MSIVQSASLPWAESPYELFNERSFFLCCIQRCRISSSFLAWTSSSKSFLLPTGTGLAFSDRSSLPRFVVGGLAVSKTDHRSALPRPVVGGVAEVLTLCFGVRLPLPLVLRLGDP